MPHSERLRRKYFSRTAPCAALGCADSGATALDGRLARRSAGWKACATARRSGGGAALAIAFVRKGLGCWSSAPRRYTKVWIDTQGEEEELRGSLRNRREIPACGGQSSSRRSSG